MPRSCRLLLALTVLAALGATVQAGDQYVITLDPAARDMPATGRVMLFFVTESGPGRARRMPARGPFWEPPQPIASIAVTDFAPGGTVVVSDANAVAWPTPLDMMSGRVHVQAVLDAETTERSHLDEPGNVLSDVQAVTLRAGADDTVELALSRRVTPRVPRRETPNLKWVVLRSPALSSFAGRDVVHRAGVAFPPGYDDDPDKRWPVVYVIPGFGGRHDMATTYADMLSRRGVEDIAPMAVHVVLDAESPLGHHGFTDSPNHGPRGTALVQELIPHLEATFRLNPRPAARILTGHSSGGWTSIWLLLQHPETFGACWSSSPDPIDFRAFQMGDLYEDPNLYVQRDGTERPSMRKIATLEGGTEVVMTVREECGMEWAMDPHGGSGEQWDAWEAMFSPRDETTGLPKQICDPKTGAVDRAVVEHWKAFDITRLVASDWKTYGPIVTGRLRLSCGEIDSFYLERAVRRFKATIERLAREHGGPTGPGYVNLVPDTSHNVAPRIFQRVNEEMRAHLAGIAE